MDRRSLDELLRKAEDLNITDGEFSMASLRYVATHHGTELLQGKVKVNGRSANSAAIRKYMHMVKALEELRVVMEKLTDEPLPGLLQKGDGIAPASAAAGPPIRRRERLLLEPNLAIVPYVDSADMDKVNNETITLSAWPDWPTCCATAARYRCYVTSSAYRLFFAAAVLTTPKLIMMVLLGGLKLTFTWWLYVVASAGEIVKDEMAGAAEALVPRMNATEQSWAPWLVTALVGAAVGRKL